MKTCWPKIQKMKEATANGDTTYLIAFIKRLGKEGLLEEHVFHGLCENRFKGHKEAWDLLHEFADKAIP